MTSARPTAVVTGASSGIGAATARALAKAGFQVLLGARRVERCAQIAAEIDGIAVPLDVTDQASVDELAGTVADAFGGRLNLLVNNAGGAKGFEPVVEADADEWRWMFETNVMGTLRVTKALVPAVIASGDGHIVTVTSVAALGPYDNGAGYTGAKHAQAMLHRTLRGELLGQPVRLTEVLPGLVETEFSLVRFGGDEQRADNVYRGITPLTADDVADVIAFAATRPSHVNLDQIVLKPRAQYDGSRVHRDGS